MMYRHATVEPVIDQDPVLGHLSHVAMAVDRLCFHESTIPSSSLRIQLRRAAVEALSHAAQALEPVSDDLHRQLLKRTLGALYQLETLTRVAGKTGSVAEGDAVETVAMVEYAAAVVRLELEAA